MRIAQIAPIPERVPPRKYGGTERVIYHLTEELVRLGHEVTLFASGDSITSARLISVVDKPLREMKGVKDIYGFNTYSLMNQGLAYSMHEKFDVIHDHNAHMGLPIANICPTPVVMTWHGPYDAEMTRYFATLNKPHLVSISKSQSSKVSHHLNFLGTVYNGLPMDNYPYSAEHDGYLLYVGRIDREKGIHHAMDVAIRLKRKLIIAAKVDLEVSHIKKYFEEYFMPRLNAHPELIEWVGEVDEAQRNELMKNAMCFLHPVTWPEPFGLTLIEAMACGCPVVAFNNGAIPEVVAHGKTGYVVENADQMVEAVQSIGKISREHCKIYSRTTFSAERMAKGYEAMYKSAIAKTESLKEAYDGKESKRQKLFLGFGFGNSQGA